MPALVAGIHVFLSDFFSEQGVDGRAFARGRVACAWARKASARRRDKPGMTIIA
jgi:hypothetical protein